MKIICGWCSKDLGEKLPIEDKNITHGICEICLIKFKQGGKSGEEKSKTVLLVYPGETENKQKS